MTAQMKEDGLICKSSNNKVVADNNVLSDDITSQFIIQVTTRDMKTGNELLTVDIQAC